MLSDLIYHFLTQKGYVSLKFNHNGRFQIELYQSMRKQVNSVFICMHTSLCYTQVYHSIYFKCKFAITLSKLIIDKTSNLFQMMKAFGSIAMIFFFYSFLKDWGQSRCSFFITIELTYILQSIIFKRNLVLYFITPNKMLLSSQRPQDH